MFSTIRTFCENEPVNQFLNFAKCIHKNASKLQTLCIYDIQHTNYTAEKFKENTLIYIFSLFILM